MLKAEKKLAANPRVMESLEDCIPNWRLFTFKLKSVLLFLVKKDTVPWK